jgi:hypothetical protein
MKLATHWRRARVAPSFLVVSLAVLAAGGCADEDSVNCTHRVCDIREESCIQFVAEVVSCQRGVPLVQPPVRFVTTEEFIAEREQPSAEELTLARDYWAGEALVGLMPEGYDPSESAGDSVSGFVAFYSWVDEEITILSDAVGDEESAYRTLVHEMIHAQQDADYDLDMLWTQYATSFPRSLGVRAAVEGEAVLYTALADLEREGIAPDEVDWQRWFSTWQDDVLVRARETEVPSLSVTGLFPYAFGGEQAYLAWQLDDLDGVREYVQTPPDSVRQVMAGFRRRPPEVFNLDAQLEPHAVPMLPGYAYLGGGGQDSWLLNTMLQRTAGSGADWTFGVDMIEADHLSVWRHDETGDRVAVWRLMGEPDVVRRLLTATGSRWRETPAEAAKYFIRLEGEDWILIASEQPNAVEVSDAVQGWQSRDEALASAELQRRPGATEWMLRGSVP